MQPGDPTIFSRIKDQLLTILTTELVDTGLAAEVRTSRGYETEITPYVIVTTRSYKLRESDGAHLVYMTIATIAKFTDATQEELAEEALDNIEQVCIDTLGRDGRWNENQPHWWAVDQDRQTYRPFSPIGPGMRYSEQFYVFVV